MNASILVVGCGGLGCPVIQYLAAAGVGRLGLVDFDTVEVSNIQRQILHFEADSGCDKIQSAGEKAEKLNSKCDVIGKGLLIKTFLREN